MDNSQMRSLLLVTLLALGVPCPLLARTLTVEELAADYLVLPNGDVRVTETLRVRFEGSWNGIFRDISLRQNTARGWRYSVGFDFHAALDEDGRALTVDRERGPGGATRLRIWVPGARDATRTILISYTLENSLRFFGERSEAGPLDELYWQVTGTGWEVPIEHARARVILPEGIAVMQAAAYVGTAESTAQSADVEIYDNVVRVANVGPLAPGEGLTVGVGWPPGRIERPGALVGVGSMVRAFWPALLPVLTFFWAWGAWRRRGKDPEKLPVTVQYEPPDGMSPAELGTLIDHKAEMHDVTATLVDLAVRGYLIIEEQKETRLFGLSTKTDYVFRLRQPQPDWDALAPHEQRFLGALFNPAAEITAFDGSGSGVGAVRRPQIASGVNVRMSDLKDRFYKSLPGIRDSIYEELIRRDLYRQRPDHVKGRWMAGAIAAGLVGVFGAGWVSENGLWGLSPITVAVAGVGSAVLLLSFGLVMPARTVRGARARERALGFREFLGRVESDRFERMITSPEMFERFLPHAMAFGVEERWAEAFENLYAEPPEWYVGGGNGSFHPRLFTENLSSMSRKAASTMASSPSSSGSGGGGSVGGGGGGGGGGGF